MRVCLAAALLGAVFAKKKALEGTPLSND